MNAKIGICIKRIARGISVLTEEQVKYLNFWEEGT